MSDPYIAERAIVLAAGRGERMRPLTDEMPKPMVRVDGRRIIDTLLAALVAAGIPEIYVVRGYLGEKFDVLKEEYPTLHFIDNPHWHEANNISSLLAAGDLVENAFVVEGDLFLQNPSLLSREQQGTNWTTEDGRSLAQSIRRLYESPGGAARYWDEAALSADIEDFCVRVRACSEKDVQEIDTVEELETLRRKYGEMEEK